MMMGFIAAGTGDDGCQCCGDHLILLAICRLKHISNLEEIFLRYDTLRANEKVAIQF